MKWEEIRKLYPNQYVLLTALNYHVVDNKKIIDDMEIVRSIQDPKEATQTLLRCKGNTFVYHTDKEDVVMEVVTYPVYRGVI